MRFDYRKTTQVINLFAQLNGGVIGKLQVMKLIYFADRLHLRRYGRTITRDEYFAMQYGPVPSAAKEIAALSNYLDPREHEYAARFILPAGDHKIHTVKPADVDVFSESDEDVVREVWTKIGEPAIRRHEFDMIEVSHLFPEWKKHATAVVPGNRARMSLRDFLDDAPPEAKAFELCPLTPERRDDLLANIDESEQVQRLLYT